MQPAISPWKAVTTSLKAQKTLIPAAMRDKMPLESGDTRSVFFGKEVLRAVIDTPDASGVSFFFARKADEHGNERDTLVLIPTSEDGRLLWSASAQTPVDSGITCPPICAE